MNDKYIKIKQANKNKRQSFSPWVEAIVSERGRNKMTM